MKNKIIKNNIINFPHDISQTEREIEAARLPSFTRAKSLCGVVRVYNTTPHASMARVTKKCNIKNGSPVAKL